MAQTLRFRIGEQGLVGWVAAHGEPALVNDVHRDTRYIDLVGNDPTLSELVVPIHDEDRVIGVLDIHDDKKDTFTEADLQFAVSLARVLGIAISNARLYRRVSATGRPSGACGCHGVGIDRITIRTDGHRTRHTYHRRSSGIFLCGYRACGRRVPCR
ncbi:MAG: GAF domain-containing protein [candidate division Zixibacteria bacterium]|nr:GAF domain-containing protein [candidate division Zixibacteria bacterium]